MNTPRRLALGASIACTGVAFTSTAHADIVGSELTDRVLLDGVGGFSLIYRGGTQPLAGNGAVADQFSIFSRGLGAPGGNFWITPFLLEITAPDQYTVAAIGTSRNTSGLAGILSFDFAAIAGDPTLNPGSNYTFGFRTAQHTADDTGAVSTVAGTENIGNVPFTGYDDFSDEWVYAFVGNLEIGTIFGTGGAAFNFQGFGGRIYSAQLSTIPTPAATATLALTALATTRRRR